MNAIKLAKLLKDLDACPAAIKWSRGKSLKQAWMQCARADWMCWLLGKQMGQLGWPGERIVRHCLIDCAKTAEKYTTDKRVAKCNRVVRRYADGEATIEELNVVLDEARDAALAAAERHDRASMYVAWATWYAARSAWVAAERAAEATAIAARKVAEDVALKQMADLIRKRVPYPLGGKGK